jgi:hypothetical protein
MVELPPFSNTLLPPKPSTKMKPQCPLIIHTNQSKSNDQKRNITKENTQNN